MIQIKKTYSDKEGICTTTAPLLIHRSNKTGYNVNAHSDTHSYRKQFDY